MIRKLPIPVAPRLLQERIVAEIEKQFSCLDEAVANLKRVKAISVPAAVSKPLSRPAQRSRSDEW
jgi:hypothetical protein